MDIKLPKAVEYIIDTLEKAGYEGFAVGGCVRDTLLGRDPQDWDITTSAKPETVKKLFRKTIDTGIEHGTVTVMIDHVGYEVTTYRIDGEYEDSRHPKNVEFTTKLNLDLERRDFTINAMAYNHSRGLVDEFEGIQDLDRKIIRCVGDAGERFDEDALRMLRAVRFSGAAWLSDRRSNQTGNMRACKEFTKDQCGADPGRTDKAVDIKRCRTDPGSISYRYPKSDLAGYRSYDDDRSEKSTSYLYDRRTFHTKRRGDECTLGTI